MRGVGLTRQSSGSEPNPVQFWRSIERIGDLANLLNWLILHLAVFTPFIREGYVAQRQWEKLFFGNPKAKGP